MVDAPILVTGFPRSGTSMLTGVLGLSGAWLGETAPPDLYNRKGTFENREVRETVLKPYLQIIGADPLGLDVLPPVAHPPMVSPSLIRERVAEIVERQGYGGGPWAYKDAKLALCWRLWAEAFPDARWIVVERPRAEVIDSALRADPMAKRFGYQSVAVERWHDDYAAHVASVPDPIRVRTDHAVKKPGRLQQVVEGLGLTWREKAVETFVDRSLWGAG